MVPHITEQQRFRRALTKRLAQIAFYNETLVGAWANALGSRERQVVWDLINEHDVVVAVWLDPSSPNQFDMMPIKGRMPSSTEELRAVDITAIACNNPDQAIGLSIMYQACNDDEVRSADHTASAPTPS